MQLARMAEQAAEKLRQEESPDRMAWETVEVLLSRALAKDADNRLAKRIAAEATAALAKFRAKGAAQGNASRVGDRRVDAWGDWLQGAATDAAKLLGAALGVAALILFIARLLLLWPMGWLLRNAKFLFRWARHPVLAVISLTTLSVLVAMMLPEVWAERENITHDHGAAWFGWWVVGLSVGGGIATFLTWAWLFQRQRVRIQMQAKGKDDSAGAAAVVAHLRSLGASPPEGLELPLGADADVLSGANLSSGALTGIFGKVLSVVQMALSVTPWRVLIDAEGDNQTIVVVSLHGRVRDTAIIRHKLVDDKSPSVDPLKLAAARVLMSILDASGNYKGMGEARHWRSVGLQYDAETTERSSSDKARILAAAVDLDPGSWPARMSYRMEMSRHSDDSAKLLELSNWLQVAAGRQRKHDWALKARMVYGAYAAFLNHRVAEHSEHSERCRCRDGQEAELRASLEQVVAKGLRKGTFERMFKQNAYALLRYPLGTTRPPPVPSGMTPSTAYTIACFAAIQQPPNFGRAIALLQFAYSDPGYKEAAASDPMLKKILESPQYRKSIHSEPRKVLTDIAPFDAYKSALTLSGLTDPDLLARWELSALAGILSTRKHTARVVRHKARLISSIPSELTAYRLEIAEALASVGVAKPGDVTRVRTKRRHARRAKRAIFAACAARSLADPSLSAVNAWLNLPERDPLPTT